MNDIEKMITEPIPEGHWRNKKTRERVIVSSYDPDRQTVLIYPYKNDSLSKSLSAEDFMEQFAPVLDHQDFIDGLKIRSKTLIEDFPSLFEDRSVLELGPSSGHFTTLIEEYAQSITVVENNPQVIKTLKQNLSNDSKIIFGDIHHELWKLSKGEHQVIVCTGLLYHSAHPFFILEGISNLEPEFILIDRYSRNKII
jgi:hypothetical protein